MHTPLISIKKLTKSFPKQLEKRAVSVLDDITLDIHKGEFLILLGPSGCGKSTLLRILSGLDSKSSGMLHFAPEYDPTRVSFVFQDFGILPWLTVEENVSINLIGNKTPRAEVDKAVRDILEVFHLTKFAARHPHELSGGMKQRVGLARAFVSKPDVIFLDEPFSELDFFTATSLRQVLVELRAASNATVIMVSHYIDEAVMLADRIAVFADRPSHIKSVIINHLARPRNPRSDAFYALEDEVLSHFDPIDLIPPKHT
jgi:NitT/TauT family transport system ATP-binding protein